MSDLFDDGGITMRPTFTAHSDYISARRTCGYCGGTGYAGGFGGFERQGKRIHGDYGETCLRKYGDPLRNADIKVVP